MLALPVIIATSPPLGIKRFNKLLIFFILAVFSGTMASIIVLFKGQITDPRELSIFISHIRFSLTICFSIFILFYFLTKKKLLNYQEGLAKSHIHAMKNLAEDVES